MRQIEEEQNQYDMSFIGTVLYDQPNYSDADNKKSPKNTLNDGQSSAIHSESLSSFAS